MSTKWTRSDIGKGITQEDESTEPDFEWSGCNKFKTTFFIAIIDHLVAELDRRYYSYKDIQQTFGFSNAIPSILQDLCTGAANLQKKYAADLQEDFVDEIGQFIKEKEDTYAKSLLQLIKARNLQSVFPNVIHCIYHSGYL